MAAAPGMNKTVAALLAGAVCAIIGNVLNHAELSMIPDGWGRWLIAALKQSDTMSDIQTILTSILVYFVPQATGDSP